MTSIRRPAIVSAIIFIIFGISSIVAAALFFLTDNYFAGYISTICILPCFALGVFIFMVRDI